MAKPGGEARWDGIGETSGEMAGGESIKDRVRETGREGGPWTGRGADISLGETGRRASGQGESGWEPGVVAGRHSSSAGPISTSRPSGRLVLGGDTSPCVEGIGMLYKSKLVLGVMEHL